MPAGENLLVHQAEKTWRSGFWSLIVTQFQGAFNENALKFLVIYLILALEKNKGQRDQLELMVGVLFAAPFILFSLVGGYLADRFSKRSVTIWTKVFEVGVMLFAAAALVGPNLYLALAERSARAGDFPGDYPGEHERLIPRRSVQRARSLFGCAAAWIHRRWSAIQLWH